MESEQKQANIKERLFIFIIGLLIMSLGIVFVIEADLGSAPWDVLNIGLFYQLGLSIGSWAIIVGFFILSLSAILSRSIPQIGAFLNMLLVGIFIDLIMLLPFMHTPNSLFGKEIMFIAGLIIMGYGMGFYIAAKLGAGPRDSLMIVLSTKLGLSIAKTRFIMEAVVLSTGWILGGPVFWGTIIYAVTIGKIAGWSIPQCEKFCSILLEKRANKKIHASIQIKNREANL